VITIWNVYEVEGA